MTQHPQQEKIEQLKKHLQQLHNDGFKVIADCESISIELASQSPAPAAPEHDIMVEVRRRLHGQTFAGGPRIGCLTENDAEDIVRWVVTTIRNRTLKKLYDQCECVPLKEYAPDYDKGFHQAMTLVRCWIDQSLRTSSTQEHQR